MSTAGRLAVGVEDADDEDVPPSGTSGRAPGIGAAIFSRNCSNHCLGLATAARCGGLDVGGCEDGGRDGLSVDGASVVETGGMVGCGVWIESLKVASAVDAPATTDETRDSSGTVG